MKCQHSKCSNKNRDFKNYKSLNVHISTFHKDFTKQQYAEQFQTEEWVCCVKCNKTWFYQNIYHQKSKYGKLCDKCRETAVHKERIESERKKKESGYYESEEFFKARIKGAKTKKANGFWSKEKCLERSSKIEATKSVPNGYYESEEYKINCAKGGRIACEKRKQDPENYKNASKKMAITNRINGLYDHDKASERAKKANITKRTNGYYQSEIFLEQIRQVRENLKEDRKQNPEKYKKAAKLGAKKAIATKIKKDFFNSKEFKKQHAKGVKTRAEREANGEYEESKKRGIQKKFDSGYYESESFLNWVKAGQLSTKWIFPNYSKESQELFKEIEKYLDCECFYATNGSNEKHTNEKRIFFKREEEKFNEQAFLDFFVPSLNKIIEFDEEYHEKQEQKRKDLIREQRIKETIPNVQILRIKIEEFKSNRQKTLKKCLDFLINDPLTELETKQELIIPLDIRNWIDKI
jgi:very-short-patch-repair endonuclease